MKANRRQFALTALGGGLASLPLCSTSGQAASTSVNDRYRKLDEILKQPVLKKQFFKPGRRRALPHNVVYPHKQRLHV